MGKEFDRNQLLDALDRVGLAAVANRETLEIAVYGGSALMLASNFRYASEDVDIAELGKPWPPWLVQALTTLAKFFPKSATDVEKHKFLLKYIWNKEAHDAPRYSGRGG